MKLQEGSAYKNHFRGTFGSIVLKDQPRRGNLKETSKINNLQDRKQEDGTARTNNQTSKRQRHRLRGHLGKPRPERQSLRGRLGLRGRAFVDALASLGDILEDGLCRNARGRAFADILENPGLRGKAFVDALASLGDTLKDGFCRKKQNLRGHPEKQKPERQSLRGRLGKPWRHFGRWAALERLRQSLRGHLGKHRP